MESLPEDAHLVLIDTELLRTIDLRDTKTYRMILGERDYIKNPTETRFQLLVGNDVFLSSQGHLMPELPKKCSLYPNFPNPFNPSTVIRYDIAKPGPANLSIYNVQGALVKTLSNKHHNPGRYETGWNGDNDQNQRVSSGVYFYLLKANDTVLTRKLVLLK